MIDNENTYLAVMDPPWSSDAGGGGRGAGEHYDLSKPSDVAAAIRGSGLWDDESNALVWMWATTRALVLGHAFELAKALNVEVVSGFVWCKVDDGIDLVLRAMTEIEGVGPATMAVERIHAPLFTPPAKPGLGQWQRTEHEHLLVCRRGKIGVPTTDARCRSVIYAPRGRHSAKPEKAWTVIERTSAGVLGNLDERTLWRGHIGVEFFARTRRDGWLAFGNQIEGDDA